MRIDVDNSIRAFDRGPDWTNGYTNGFFAVIADQRQEEFLGMGVLSLLYFFDPAPPNAQGNIIFTLTGYSAGMAADALPQVEQHSVAYGFFLHVVLVFIIRFPYLSFVHLALGQLLPYLVQVVLRFSSCHAKT
jgi:hypothetical protein